MMKKILLLSSLFTFSLLATEKTNQYAYDYQKKSYEEAKGNQQKHQYGQSDGSGDGQKKQHRYGQDGQSSGGQHGGGRGKR